MFVRKMPSGPPKGVEWEEISHATNALVAGATSIDFFVATHLATLVHFLSGVESLSAAFPTGRRELGRVLLQNEVAAPSAQS